MISDQSSTPILPLLGRFAPRAGLVTLRQKFVCRSQKCRDARSCGPSADAITALSRQPADTVLGERPAPCEARYAVVPPTIRGAAQISAVRDWMPALYRSPRPNCRVKTARGHTGSRYPAAALGLRGRPPSSPQNPRLVPTPHAQLVAAQGALPRRSSEAISSSPPQSSFSSPPP